MIHYYPSHFGFIAKIKINKKEKKEIIPIRDMILTVSAKWIS